MQIDQNERISIPKSQANIALSLIEIAQKIGEVDMIRNIGPMIAQMSAHGIFANLKDGMSNREELDVMKYLVQLYGVQDVNLEATDPTMLANSIKLNSQKKENSFYAQGLKK